jgi:hypothetical protein
MLSEAHGLTSYGSLTALDHRSLSTGIGCASAIQTQHPCP